MPKEVEEKVKKLLADPDFYPDKDEDERKSIAWGIAQKQYKEEHKSDSSVVIPTIKFTNAVGELSLISSEEGDILLFTNALLCHAGGNKNRDFVPEDELHNLASTIGGRPIDEEHDEQEIRGVYTAGRVVYDELVDKNALAVDGLIWADRFPNEADGVKTGEIMLSVEAAAETASCTICDEVFASVDEYCKHIKNRNAYGAFRRLHSLKAKGGALTRRPADADAGFAPATIRMVASHQEDHDGSKQEKHMKTVEELQQALADLQARLDAEVQKVTDLTAKVSELTGQLETANSSKAELQGNVDQLNEQLVAAKARSVELLAQNRREALRATLSDEEWEEKREAIMGMTDEAFKILASVAEKPKDKAPQKFDVLGGSEDNKQPVGDVTFDFS